jgi:hypothetical protein
MFKFEYSFEYIEYSNEDKEIFLSSTKKLFFIFI